MPKLITGITVLDKFLDGGIPLGEEILFSGAFSVGKTIFTLQLLYEYVSQYGENVIFINTEEKMRNSFPFWNKAFRERFKIENKVELVDLIITEKPIFKMNKKKQPDLTTLRDYTIEYKVKPPLIVKNELNKPAIIIAFIPDIHDLLALVGRPGTFTTEESGYQKFRSLPSQIVKAKYSLLGQIMENYDVKFILMDSITAPIKNAMDLVKGNERARANVQAKLLGRLKELSNIFDSTVICTSHAVGDAGNYTAIEAEKEWGGNVVGHSFKYKLHLRHMPKKAKVGKATVSVPNWKGKRQLYIRRWATMPDMEMDEFNKPKYTVLELGSSGFVDPRKKKVGTKK